MHLKSIHYLRAVAAIMVVVFHIFNLDFMVKDLDYVYWMCGGVDIFFVISGFVMVRSTANRDISAGRFMIQRAQRIIPLYWIATFAAMMEIQGQWGLKLYSLFFIPTMNPEIQKMQPVLEPGWTLNYEMFFYVIFALSLFFKDTYRFLLVMIVMVGLVALGMAIEGGDLFEFYCRPIILEFVGGMAIARFGWRVPVAALPAGLFLMIVLQPLMLDRIFALGIPAMMIVAGALSAEKHVPEWKFAELLGSASYSIYLFHLLALGFVFKIWSYTEWSNAAFVAIALPFVILTGCGIHWALERPIIAFFSALKAKRQNAASLQSGVALS